MENKYKAGLNIWLHSKGETVFCQGRAMLLEGIKEHGSLRQSAKSLGMSYRAAWGKLKKTQDILGFELVVLTKSRPQHYELTPRGEEILAAFKAWNKRVRDYADRESGALAGLFDPSSPH